MFILIISRGCPSKREPTWGNFENEQALALQKAGHNVIVASTDLRIRFYKRKIGITQTYFFDILNYTIFFPLPYPIIPIRLQTFIGQQLLLKLYMRIRYEHGIPDVIHAHYMYNITNAVFLKKLFNFPIIGTEHWSKLTKKKIPKALIYQGNIAYKNIEKLISVSSSAAYRIENNFNVKCEVIPNMVDTEHFKYKPEIVKSNEVFVFLAVGSLISRKGYDLLISAFARAELGKNVIIKIVGEGKLRGQIQKLINEYELSKNIFLLGSKTKEEIVDLMQQSDAFVLASRAETFGVVFIEAMACGLPVIGTSCGGPEEFINQSNGLVVPVNDVTSLTIALKKMYSDINRYDRKIIAHECERSFSSEKIVKQLEKIYKEVLTNK